MWIQIEMSFIPGESGGANAPSIASVNGSGITVSVTSGGVDNLATALVAGGGIAITPSPIDKSISIAAVGPSGISSITSPLGSGIQAVEAPAGTVTLTGQYIAGSNIQMVPSGVNQTVVVNNTQTSSAGIGSGIQITTVGTNSAISTQLQGAPGISITPSTTTNAVTIANTGVTQAIAGSGIGVSAASGNVTFTNTGVRTVTGGAGIQVVPPAPSSGDVTINNIGVISAIAGAGIAVSSPTGTVQITNSGLLGLTAANAGSGITIGGTPTNPTISATGDAGVTQIIAGGGISLNPPSPASGAVTITNSGITNIISPASGIGVVIGAGVAAITNTGVTSVVSGSNINVTSSAAGGTGTVTINAVGIPPAIANLNMNSFQIDNVGAPNSATDVPQTASVQSATIRFQVAPLLNNWTLSPSNAVTLGPNFPGPPNTIGTSGIIWVGTAAQAAAAVCPPTTFNINFRCPIAVAGVPGVPNPWNTNAPVNVRCELLNFNYGTGTQIGGILDTQTITTTPCNTGANGSPANVPYLAFNVQLTTQQNTQVDGPLNIRCLILNLLFSSPTTGTYISGFNPSGSVSGTGILPYQDCAGISVIATTLTNSSGQGF